MVGCTVNQNWIWHFVHLLSSSWVPGVGMLLFNNIKSMVVEHMLLQLMMILSRTMVFKLYSRCFWVTPKEPIAIGLALLSLSTIVLLLFARLCILWFFLKIILFNSGVSRYCHVHYPYLFVFLILSLKCYVAGTCLFRF